jgi:hypothetical protein
MPDNALTVKNFTTKATAMVALTSNPDMHTLPQVVATRFATRLKGGAGATAAAGQGGGQGGGVRSASSDLKQIIITMPPCDTCSTEAMRALMIAATASTKPSSVTVITFAERC